MRKTKKKEQKSRIVELLDWEEAESEDRHNFRPITLRQLLGTADDRTLFHVSLFNGKDDPEVSFLNSDFADDDKTVCDIVDPLLDMKVHDLVVGESDDPTKGAPKGRMVPTVWLSIK